MCIDRFRASRRASVGLMFALGAIPIIGLVGVAVDFGIWNQTNSVMSVAANVAALTAVKVAANAQLAVDPNAQNEGVQAGSQWFQAEVGGTHRIGTQGLLAPPTVTVNLTLGATVSAKVLYSGQVPSVFGGIFGVGQYSVAGSATAQVTTAPYLDVEMLLDNSSSMDIGATPADMALLQQISACDASNVVYGDGSQGSLDPYDSYAYYGSGRIYDGPLRAPLYPNPPVVLTGGTSGNITLTQGTPAECKGFKLPIQTQTKKYPLSGPPCEFACHWDPSHNSGLAQDLYGAARRTLGNPDPAKRVQLRFDLVKIATNAVLNAMRTDDLDIHNLRAGVFTFNTQLTQIYPASGEAADDWASAISSVGLPPTLPMQEETGILPVIGKRQNVPNDDTDIVDSMNTLRTTYLTSGSGDGTTSAKPRKVMFLITDGFMDDNARGRSAFPTGLCDAFKNAGYTIYVVFTPYYGIMHIAYLSSDWTSIVYGNTGGDGWGNTPGTLAYGLQQCASSTSDYISATDGPTLQAALQLFLKKALDQPARFTN